MPNFFTREANMDPSQEKPTTGGKGRLTIDLNVCASQMEELNLENTGLVFPDHAEENIHRDHATPNETECRRQEHDVELNSTEAEDGLKATNLVRQYHGVLKKAAGKAAVSRGEAGLEKDGQLIICYCCGNPESLGKTIICDGCESSFHVGCMKLRVKQAAKLDEWVCPICNTKGVRPQWLLGRVVPSKEIQEAETGRNGEGVVLISEKEQSSRSGARLSSAGNQEERVRKSKRRREVDGDIRPGKKLARSRYSDIVNSKLPSNSRFEQEMGHLSFNNACCSHTIGNLTRMIRVPLQCMDLRIESFGTVDLRPGYSDANHIWPVGYCCSWHDSVTGSICISQVLEGGPSGPIFRVTRKPCSSLSDMGNSHEVQAIHRKRNGDQVDKNEFPVHGDIGNSNKLLAEGNPKSLITAAQGGLIDPYSHSNCKVDGGSKQLYDEDDELCMLLGNLESFRPGGMTSCRYSGILGNESVLGWKSGDCFPLQNINTDLVNDRATVMAHDQDRSPKLAGKSIELATISTPLNGSFRSGNEEASSLVKGFSNTLIEENIKEEGSAVRVALHTSATLGNVKEFPTKEITNSSQLPNGEIIVEATSSTEAWKELAKQFAGRYAESLRHRTNFQVGCIHSETASSSPGLYLADLLEGHANEKPGDGGDDHETLCKSLQDWVGQDRFGFDIPVVQKIIRAKKTEIEATRPPPPHGRPVGRKVPAGLVGDLLQIWEFLCRFYEVLGQKEPPSLDDLEEGLCDYLQGETRDDDELTPKREAMAQPEKHADEHVLRLSCSAQETNSSKIFKPNLQQIQSNKTIHTGMSCHSAVLAALHISILKILLAGLQPRVLGGLDLTADPKRGKKKDAEPTSTIKRQTWGLIPLNETTWPEVARRYVVASTSLNFLGENAELNVQEQRKLLQCILGDGGVLCGALDGVAGIEIDAQLLAEAEKRAFGERPSMEIEYENIVEETADDLDAEDFRKPEWAEVLEPVRKLATNVGARIRNCIRDALSRDPPEWAREILEWSISKEVYKGNASGPTKRAVLSVLAKLASQEQEPKIKKVKRLKFVVPTPALVMRRCRAILRQLITSDEWRIFCNLLSGTVLGYYEKRDDGSEIAPVMVSRPLDFRIIDSRLAAGAYGESHESFLADMQQLWSNIPVVFQDREDMMKVGESLSQQFETLYQNRVMTLINRKEEARDVEETSQEPSRGLDEELMKAPWEEGVCKICGTDKDDDLVLLCDGCDAEYHMYCLNPPLSKIPDGNWYCPACITHDGGLCNSNDNKATVRVVSHAKTTKEEDCLRTLGARLGERDYWKLNMKERIFLLKFLCDKVLDSAVIRDHLEQCGETSLELQQKLRSLLLERQNHAVRGVNQKFDSLTEENSEVASRETLGPKRRGRKSTRTFDSGSFIEEIEAPGNRLEEMGKQHVEHQRGGGGVGVLPKKEHLKANVGPGSKANQDQPLESQLSKHHSAVISTGIRDIERTTEDVSADLNMPIQAAQQGFSKRMGIITLFDSQSRVKAQATSKVLEGREKTLVDLSQRDKCEFQRRFDESGEYFELDNTKHCDFLSANNNDGNDGYDQAFVVHEQLHEVLKHMERNNRTVDAIRQGSLKSTTSFFSESDIDAVQTDDKGGGSNREDTEILDQKIRLGGHQTSLPLQISNGEQGLLTANAQDAALDDLIQPAEAAGGILEAEIESTEVEIMKTALRRERLGTDLPGRMYWALARGGKLPWLVVDEGNANVQGSSQSERENELVCSGVNSGVPSVVSNNVDLENQPMMGTGHLMSNGTQSNARNWITYESDADFQQLFEWLNPKCQMERNLKSAILQWRMPFRTHRESFREISHKQQTKMKALGAFPGTKATTPFIRKFGPIVWPEVSNDLHVRKRGRMKKVITEDSMFRCDCLELVWPTRCHCECCHETFDSSMELQSHNNGLCYSRLSALHKQVMNMPLFTKGKKRKGDVHTKHTKLTTEDGMLIRKNHKVNGKRRVSILLDFPLVVKRFSIPSSTRERILQIGCIADNGPTFAPALSFSPAFDPSLCLQHTTGNADGNLLSAITNLGLRSSSYNSAVNAGSVAGPESHLAEHQPSNEKRREPRGDMFGTFTTLQGKVDISSNMYPQSQPFHGTVASFSEAALGRELPLPSEVCTVENGQNRQNVGGISSNRGMLQNEVKSIVPVASMQPLSGKNLWIFKRLKANLLDIEAMLAPEAFEPSRGHAFRRRSWRLFVKSAASIYGLIQAVVILEQMLKADCLRDSWCNWASISAGAKTTTLSSLALRIYSLDAAIKYKMARVVFDSKDGEKSSKH